MQHEYNIYDDEDNLIQRYLFNKDTYYDENQTPILLTIDDFTISIKKNYKKVKVQSCLIFMRTIARKHLVLFY